MYFQAQSEGEGGHGASKVFTNGACHSFCSTKRFRVLALHPGRDASASLCYPV